MDLHAHLKAYLEANGKSIEDVSIEDALDGRGPRIVNWPFPDVPQPTAEDLDALDGAVEVMKAKERLKALDAVLPRFNEDVAERLELPLFGAMADAKAEKETLRELIRK